MSRPPRHDAPSDCSSATTDEGSPRESPLHGTTLHRRLTIRVNSVGGEQLYQHCPTRDDNIHWAYIMSHILAQTQGPAPCHIALFGNSDVDQCFAAGSSFSSLFWVDMDSWHSLIAQVRATQHLPPQTEGQQYAENTEIVEVNAVFSPCITTGALVYGGYTFGHWTIADITCAGINGCNFSLIHSTTHMQRICRSRALRTWRNQEGMELGHAVCLELTRLMPFSRGLACAGCARLLHPLSTPGRYASVRLTTFQASSSECECSVRGRSLTVQSMPFNQFQ